MNTRQSNLAWHALLLLCLVCSVLAASANPKYRVGSGPAAASTVTRKAPVRNFKGQRKLGWKRRNLDPEEPSAYDPLKSTTILVYGKGADRTTFLIKCNEAKNKAIKDKMLSQDRHAVGPPHDVCDEAVGAPPDNGSGGDVSSENGDGGNYAAGGDYGSDGSSSGGSDGADGSNGVAGSTSDGSDGSSGSSGSGSDSQLATSGGYGSGSSCAAIAQGNGPTSDSLKEYQVYLDVVKNSDFTWAQVEDLMRKDLQYNVAPKVSDCEKEASAAPYDGNVQEGGSSSGGQTLITNVVFGSLSQSESACSDSSGQVATSASGECSAMVIPAKIYYTGADTSGFADRLAEAINSHYWSVPGLVDVSDASVSETSKVSSAVAAETQEDQGLKPGGFVAIAAAFLVLLLLLAMLVRRRRRQDVKHIELDDDDTYLKDIEGDSQDGSPRRMAHLVGDEDSVLTGWTGNSHLRSKSSTMPSFDGEGTDGFFRNSETRPSNVDVHKCSSAFCEVCESKRQAGLQFIPATTPHSPSALPVDASREYAADDTVNL